MGTALYRSYRSKSFDEVLGQEHITQTLKNSIKSGTFAHAYLFTGPRGVGKTSVARILAFAVNNATYPPTSTEVDIIEIDAASNRRIDEVRDLRERILIAPMNLKYKVYIIDEVHMLTREAFNALLKTLEEPPDHAIFILATTDVNKVPDTIVSRCLRFHFRPIEATVLAKHLKLIAVQEKISIDDDSLRLISEASDGSVRDAISLLDQLRGLGKEIRSEEVKKVLGLGSEKMVGSLVQAVSYGDIKSLTRNLELAEKDGVRVQALSTQIARQLKEGLVSNQAVLAPKELVELLESLNVASKQDDKTLLELCLLKAAASTVPAANLEKTTPKRAEEATSLSQGDYPSPNKAVAASYSASESQHELLEEEEVFPGNDELWESILSELKENNRSLYSIARMAHIETTDKKMLLTFRFPFHYKQMTASKNKNSLELSIKNVAPQITTIEVKLKDSQVNADDQSQDLTNITNIFGSSEVLES